PRPLATRARELAGAGGGREAGELAERQGERQRRQDLLPGLAVGLREAGAERLVPRREGVQGGGQGRGIERAAESHREGDVVGRPVGLQAGEEPHTPLDGREGNGVLDGRGRPPCLPWTAERERRVAPTVPRRPGAAGLLDRRRQTGDRRRGEERAEGQAGPEEGAAGREDR